jgi:hypothetical protein
VNGDEMDQTKRIEPHKVTKPIQLLAAWLVGLTVVDGAFLAAAAYIQKPDWVPGVLVCASVVNVPLFLISIFLLQTKFRPEMQEDSFYSKYLETKTGNTRREVTAEALEDVREQIAGLTKEQEERFNLIVQEKFKLFDSQESQDAIKELEKAIKEAELKFRQNRNEVWVGKTISVNQQLECFPEIVKALAQARITVHETFGAGIDPPNIFRVAVGSGFSVDQLRQLVEAVAPILDGIVYFAEDDEQSYANIVLIGAYGKNTGLTFRNFIALLSSHALSDAEMYKVLGMEI